MKVLLLNPPPKNEKDNIHVDAVISRHTGAKVKTNYILPPLGLMYISAYLEKLGYKADILDSMVEKMNYKQVISKVNDYDIVFCTVPTSTCNDVYEFLKDLRVRHRIVMGTHASYFWKKILEDGIADYVIDGEPEVTAAELVNAIHKKQKFSSVKGLHYKEGKKLKSNPKRELMKDLDLMPLPSRNNIDNSKYYTSFFPGDKFTLVLTSRGCPFKCVFCATHLYHGNTWRPRGVENIMKELREIRNVYGVRKIGFWDDTFTIDKKRVIGLCKEIIKEKLDIEWICLGRVDNVDYEVLRWMAKAGCKQIQYGAESGSNVILKNIKKGINMKQIEDGVKATKKAGIEQILFFMIGNPGETLDTVRKTIKFAIRLDPDYVSFNIATPYPGSAVYEEIKSKKYNWDDFDTMQASVPLCELDKDQLNDLVKYAYRKFYFRPKYIAKTFFKHLKKPKNWLPIAKASIETLKMTRK